MAIALGLNVACQGKEHDIGDGLVDGSGGAAIGTSTSSAGITDSAGGTGANTNTTAGGSGGSTLGPPAGDACEGLPYESGAAGAGDEGCVGTGYEVEHTPLDMYIMVDETSSMENTAEPGGATRWEVVTGALKDFVTSDGVADIGIGIQFFSWVGDDDCDPGQYANPAVPIGPAPQVATEIIAALDAEAPIGQTPTYAALLGAVQYAKQWATENPGRQTVVVFVTDGYPTRCDPQDVSDIAQVAANSFSEEPQVPIYVVGIDGIYNLDQLALAGGTRSAFNVASGGTTELLVQTLSNITNEDVRCEFEIPDPPEMMGVDFKAVQMVHTPANGEPREIPFSAVGYQGCFSSENGGWYYAGEDDAGNPTKILTCPCTCASFQAGKVEVTLGCEPNIIVN